MNEIEIRIKETGREKREKSKREKVSACYMFICSFIDIKIYVLYVLTRDVHRKKNR